MVSLLQLISSQAIGASWQYLIQKYKQSPKDFGKFGYQFVYIKGTPLSQTQLPFWKIDIIQYDLT